MAGHGVNRGWSTCTGTKWKTKKGGKAARGAGRCSGLGGQDGTGSVGADGDRRNNLPLRCVPLLPAGRAGMLGTSTSLMWS